MRQTLRLLLIYLVFFNIHAAFGQGVDTIFGCDEIPATPAQGVACTICNFNTLYGTTTPFTESDNAGWCGTIENDQYIGFVAGPTGIVSFEMSTFNCANGQGVQVGIYSSDNALVGDCLGQVNPGTPQIFSGGGLTPGTVYYLRIDGFAGDDCEFNITVISGLISAGPDAPGPIMGQDKVCWDNDYSYFLDPVMNATGYYWQVEFGPFTAGLTVDPPEALNPLEGTTDLAINIEFPEIPAAMPPGTCDTVKLTVRPLNPCFISEDSSTFNIRICKPSQDTTYADLCPGGEYEFPLGSGEFYDVPFTFTTIELPPGPDGCDTFAVLFLEQVTGGISDSIYPIVLCPGEVFDECGFPDPSIGAGPTTCLIESTDPNVCDSLVIFFVTILDPDANIEATRGTISCTQPTDELFAVTRTGGIPPSSSGDTISYQWSGPMGALGTAENQTITEPGTYTLVVTMTSNLDPGKSCSATTTINISDTRTAPNPPSVAGNFSICADNVPQNYTATGATGTDQYYWTTVPATGATTTNSGGTLTVSDFGTLTSLTVCAQTFNACDTSAAACEVITLLPLPTPATIAGPTELCEGANGTFTIGSYDAAQTYVVSSTPAGATASISGSNISFTMGTASGDLCIEVSNSCGTLAPVCVPVNLLPEPVAIAPTGATSVCVGQVENYNIYSSLPAGTTAAVTVTGGTVTADNGTDITVEWTGSGPQTICVVYTSTCGDSAPACLNVDVSTAGSATLTGGGEYCEGNNDLDITITFVGAGPFDYTYTVDGVAQSGSSATSPVVITTPAVGDYVLTAFSVGSCAGTVSGNASVIENPTPTATISGGDQLCTNETTDLSVSFTGTGPWTFEYALDGAGQGDIPTSTNPYLISIGDEGSYTLLSVVSDAGCVGTVSGTATVTELDPLATTDPVFACDATSTNYTVSFTISGGDPSTYAIVPSGAGSISGNVFTSNPIPNGTGYTFAVGDGSDCPQVAVVGSHDCPCLTMIGTLSPTTFALCGLSATADAATSYNTSGEFQDGDDTRVYVLHTGSGTTITGAIATNVSGVFAFDPATMTYGTTYYVSVVVGNADGAGGVDLADVCTLIASGVEVTWSEEPTATLAGGGDICVGSDTTMLVSFTGTAPWTFSYTVGTDNFTETTSDNPFTIALNGLAATTTVALNTVSAGGCDGDATGSETITVREGVQVSATTACNGTFTAYQVTLTISGGDPSSYVVTPNTGTLTGNTFVSDPIPAGAGYTFVVDDQYGCDPQVATRASVPCDCVSDAGTMPADPILVCGTGDITVVMPTDTTMDADDVLNFILHNGTSNAVGSTVLAQQASPTFSFIPGTTLYGTTYYVSSVMGNLVGGTTDLDDSCLDVAVGTPVRWNREATVTLSGDQDVCVGEPIGLVFEVDTDSPVSVTYTNGTSTATISLNAGTNPVVGFANEAGTYTITAASTTACPANFSGTAEVGVHAPVTATATEACNTTATAYVVTITIDLGDPSTYQVVPNTGTLVGNVFTSDPIPASDGYSFTVTDQWGCSPVVVQEAAVDCDCLTEVGSISSDFASCDQNELATFTYDDTGEFLDGDDAVEYILHSGDVNAPIARSSTPEFAFDPATMTFGTTYFVTAVAGNAVGGTVDLSDSCTEFSNTLEAIWSNPPTVVLSGDYTVCPGVATPLTFTVTGPGTITVVYTNGTTQWTETFTAGSTDIPAPVAGEANYSIVSVTSAACPGTFSGGASVVLLDGPSVGTPNVSINSTGTQYEVVITISGGDPATYTVNGTPLNGATTFNSGPIDCGTPWTYTVDDAGGCDPVTNTLNPDCTCLSRVGSLAGQFESCDPAELATFTYNSTGENLDGDDALQYLLYQTSPAAALASSATPTFGFDPANMTLGTTYSIVAVVGNSADGINVDLTDPCLATSAPVSAVWYESPGATISGPTAICEGETLTLTFTTTGSASQKTVYYTINGVLDSLTNVTPNTPTDLATSIAGDATIILTGVADANCASVLNEQLVVSVATEILLSNVEETCNATGTEYVVTFEIRGGDPASYVVLPAGSGTLSGSNPVIFTSNPIANGVVYDFTVSDASGCFEPNRTNNPRCDCSTDAGEMQELTQVSVCYGSDIDVSFLANSENLDPNDVLWFALRTDDDALDYTDDLIRLSMTPVFSTTDLTPGEVYYVSPVAADALGSGEPDANDPCLDIGPATPVFIQALPDGQLTGDTIICEGGTADIVLVLVGNGPFDVSINRGVDGSDTTITSIQDGHIYQVDPVTGTVYIITEIADSSVPQCTSTPTSTVNIGVEDLLSAGVAAEDLTLCEQTGDVIQLNGQITGADAGGTWTQVSGPAAGGGFNAAGATVSNASLEPGVYNFAYTVGSGAPCPTDTEDIIVEIAAAPDADAGADQVITCDDPVVQLGSGAVGGLNYNWTGGTVASANSASTSTQEAGTFTLTVTDASAGCEGIDEVVVIANDDIPEFQNMLVRDITCFGDTDGAIFTGVTGGTGPYDFTLNGSSPASSGQFTGLVAGDYTLQVVDALGCEYVESVIVEAAKELIVNAGPDATIDFGTPYRVQLYLEGDVESVRWVGDSLECISTGPLCDDLILYPQFSGTYQVTVRDSNGCSAKDVIQLLLEKDRPVYVPTGFSPNGDANNDKFFVQAREGVLDEVTNLQVFDRWGEMVYAIGVHQPNNEDDGWDGRFRGETLNPQVFTWYCTVKYADGDSEVLKGDLTLIGN